MGNQRTKRPTIKDIARLVGVTPATVSMALNNSGRISAKTRERVLDVAHQLDYHPNPLARGLVAQKTNLIGVALVEVAVSFFKDILRGLEDALQPHGYGLILNVTNGDPEREERFVRLHSEKQVDGLILEPTSHFENRSMLENMAQSGLPIVTILHSTWGWGNSSISVNNELGARQGTELLLKNCRRIAHLRGPHDSIESLARLRGYRKALRAAHVAEDPKLLGVNGTSLFTVEEGFSQMQRLLQSNSIPPEGVFAASDSLAWGAVRAIREAGLRVPDDIQVVGFDDIEMATLCYPPLTTVAQPKYPLGFKAGQMLLQMIEDRKPQREILMPELIIRESTRANDTKSP